MFAFILRRLLGLIPVLLGVSTVVFIVLQLTPGDPARLILGDFATREAVEALRAQMGLDQPIHVQYGRYIGDLVQGDLGRSITQRQPVISLIGQRLGATMELAFLAIIVATIIGVTLGILAATRQNSVIDYIVTTVSLVGVSVPIFYLGLLLILFFSIDLGWLPVSGRGDPLLYSIGQAFTGDFRPLGSSLRHLALPALTLGLSFAALMAKMSRGAMLEVLEQDFIRTARAKGLRQRAVIVKHALKNAGVPLLTILGLQFSNLLGGSVLTETVFAWPGLGRLAVDAIFNRDFPLIQGTVLTVALIFVLINLFVDVAYGLIDPRITYS